MITDQIRVRQDGVEHTNRNTQREEYKISTKEKSAMTVIFPFS